MTEQPLVSIVLPTYNGGKYLSSAIKSICEQEYTNWELIIVDDASSDDSALLINEAARSDRRVKCIRHSSNRRLPASLNTGFSAAQGQFLTWTSDDNLYRTRAIKTMVAFLLEHPKVDFVYCDQSVINAAEEEQRVYTAPPPDSLLEGPFLTGCFLYRRSVHELVGPYAEDLFLAEDYDFCLRALARCQMHPLNENLYLYRQHDMSLSMTRRHRAMLATEQAILRNLSNLRLNRSQKALAYYSVSRRAKERKAWVKCGIYLLRAGMGSPRVVFSNLRKLVKKRRACPML